MLLPHGGVPQPVILPVETLGVVEFCLGPEAEPAFVLAQSVEAGGDVLDDAEAVVAAAVAVGEVAGGVPFGEGGVYADGVDV